MRRVLLLAMMVLACGGKTNEEPAVDSGVAVDSASLDSATVDTAVADSAVVDTGTAVDTGTTPPPFCPQEASSCPDGCFAVKGNPYDAARGCLLAQQTVGCLPKGAACDAVITCKQRTSDGAMFRFGGNCFIGFASWSDCGSPNASKVISAPPCP
jgi:hypothetical protein